MKQAIAACLSLGFIAPACLHAADNLSGEVGVGAIYTDNIRLTQTDTQSDTIGVATTDFLLHEETRRLVGDVAADLQYLTFEHEVYHNEVLGDLTGSGKFAVIPGRFDWVLQDNFGQQQITPGAPVTPLNLENINYVSTGPNFVVPLGGQLQAQLQGRYSNVWYQLDDLNNNRGDVLLALLHPLSANSNVSFNASAERVIYVDDVGNSDYTTREGYVHYDAKGARSKVELEVGYDDATIMGSTLGGALVRIVASRILSPSTSIELSAGQDISNAGDLLRQMQGASNVSVATAAIQRSEDPFTSRYAAATWRFDRHRTGLAVALSQYRERHTEQVDLDRTRTELDASVRRNLSENVALNLGGGYARETYLGALTPNDSYFRGTVDLAWRVGRRVQLHAQYSHTDYKSEALFNSYNENRFMLTAGIATENWTGFTASQPNLAAPLSPTIPGN